MDMKVCTRCKESKPPNEYYRFKGRGLYPHCRSCHLAYTSNWALLHPEQKRQYARDAYWRDPVKHREKSAEWNASHREVVLVRGKKSAHQRWLTCIEGLGGKCVCCGEILITMLEIDHINGFGNAHRRRAGGSVGVYCEIIKRNFPRDEFAVRCANCNQSRRRNHGTCEHQVEKREEA